VVLPAYNAAKTLEKSYADIPKERVSKIILVDDVSQDQTVEVARSLGLKTIIHVQNRGYGGNQKPVIWRLSRKAPRSWSCCIQIINTTRVWCRTWFNPSWREGRTW
jgi:Glycosyl transferase family 2